VVFPTAFSDQLLDERPLWKKSGLSVFGRWNSNSGRCAWLSPFLKMTVFETPVAKGTDE
jgi:hypothetical protein